MTTKFCVVRYVPNPLASEQVNIGLIAWRGEEIRARFVDHWSRIQRFGHEDIGFLRDFAERVLEATADQGKLPGVAEAVGLNTHALERIVGSWGNSIQFSEAKASLLAPDEVLGEMIPIFLREPSRREVRDRRVAARYAFEGISKTLGQKAKGLIKKRAQIDGAYDQHRFDVVVANGAPLFAAQGFSFEIPDTVVLMRDLDALAWTIADVKRARRSFPLAVVVLPPSRASVAYTKARKIFPALKADLLTRSQIEPWAARQQKKVRAACPELYK